MTDLAFAKKHRPIIIMGFLSELDYPVRINFGKFVLGHGKLKKVKPVLYWWRRGNIIGFGVYHWYDYTDCPFGKPFGEHRHDFEGGLIRVNDDGSYDTVTTFHHDRPCRFGITGHPVMWWIEARGHGITPNGLHLPEYIEFTAEAEFKYISLDKMVGVEWETIQAGFGKVNMPDRWKCGDLNFWDNPKEIFEKLNQ